MMMQHNVMICRLWPVLAVLSALPAAPVVQVDTAGTRGDVTATDTPTGPARCPSRMLLVELVELAARYGPGPGVRPQIAHHDHQQRANVGQRGADQASRGGLPLIEARLVFSRVPACQAMKETRQSQAGSVDIRLRPVIGVDFGLGKVVQQEPQKHGRRFAVAGPRHRPLFLADTALEHTDRPATVAFGREPGQLEQQGP